MDVTIVIPIYNRKDFIRTTIDRIDVKYPLILVDNGSTDGSFEVCSEIVAARLNTILVVEQKPGAAAARNKGLALCKTEWIYFFDSDDVFTCLPAEWNNDVDMVCLPIQQECGGKLRTRAYFPVDLPHVQILSSMLNTPSVIYKTSFLMSAGGWNESCLMWDDWELGLRSLLRSPKVQWIESQEFHVIHIHPHGMTGPSLSSRTDEIVNTLHVVFDDIYNSDDRTAEHRKAFAALFYRCYILSGKMLREGCPECSAKVHTFIFDKFRVNKLSHMMGRLFEWASSKGVRGVWRIALRIV